MNKAWLFCLVAMSPVTFSAPAQSGPKYKEYPATTYQGPKAPLRAGDDIPEIYADLLEEAANDPINFAGRYVFVELSAGTRCASAAAIDAKTGQASFLPFATCFWRAEDPPFYYRADSHLLVVGGMIGEAGEAGPHYFVFDGGQFVAVSAGG